MVNENEYYNSIAAIFSFSWMSDCLSPTSHTMSLRCARQPARKLEVSCAVGSIDVYGEATQVMHYSCGGDHATNTLDFRETRYSLSSPVRGSGAFCFVAVLAVFTS
jgi:hypothetical protein